MKESINKPIRLNQINLIVAITNELTKQAGKNLTALPRQMNAIITAANTVIEAFEQPYRAASPGCGLNAWLQSDDTGLSSLFMAYKLFSAPHAEYNYPHDAGDFGRCFKLCHSVVDIGGSWEPLKESGKEWYRLVAEWPALSSLYMENKNAELTTRIQDLTRDMKER